MRIPSILCLLMFSGSVLAANTRFCGLSGIPPERPNKEISALSLRQALPPADTQGDPTQIDVMFLYTPEALIGAGTEAKLIKRIQQALDEANYTYTNSQINISVNPVFIGQIEYQETGDIQQDLSNLATGFGIFQSVSTLRNDYKADIVCLITELENFGIGGLAWDIPATRGNSSTAFLAIRRQALGPGIVLSHELGHLLGCAHDREHSGDPENPFYLSRRPYIFGYRLQVEGVTYIDVMAYEPGVQLPFYANPRMDLDGVPLGIAEFGIRPSDTARTINETAPYVAAYRQASSRIGFASARTEVLREDSAINVRVVRTGDLASPTSVTVSILAASTAVPGEDYALPSTFSIPFASGEPEANYTIPLVAGAQGGPRTLELSLNSPIGPHGIGLQGSTTITILDRTPVVKVNPVSASERAGTVKIVPVFTGSVSATTPRVTWLLENGSAIAGQDFQSASGVLKGALRNGAVEFEPIEITITNDQAPEPDKTFSIVFEQTTYNGKIYGNVTNTIRLLDDDRAGAFLDAPGQQLDPDGGLNVAVRHDRKLLVWGSFATLDGLPRTGIALLNSDGSVDDSFRPPQFLAGHRHIDHVANAFIGNARLLPDGKYLVAGEFSRADGKARSTLARLNADGSLDDTFGSGLQFDGAVDTIAIQPDGKVLVGGAFENINGQPRAFIARLNADGSVDETFKPNGGPSSSWTVFVLTLAVQRDGKILMGGLFEAVDGVSSPNVARLNADGTLDPTFQLFGASGPVQNIQIHSDGRIVVAGLFDEIGGIAARKLARLNPDGSVDFTFIPPQPNAEVRSVITLPDGRLLIGGAFTKIGNEERRFVAMLKADGSLDPEFDIGAGPDERPGAMSIHADGSLYIPGLLKQFNSLDAASLARVHLGGLPTAITAFELTPRSELKLQASVFPGGTYVIESSPNFTQWSSAGQIKAEGFAREQTTIITQLPGHRFLRLKNAP